LGIPEFQREILREFSRIPKEFQEFRNSGIPQKKFSRRENFAHVTSQSSSTTTTGIRR
jgi:hypothetical protein